MNRPRSTLTTEAEVPTLLTRVSQISRYTTYIRLVRVTASIQRFIFNCRHCNEERQTGALKTTEIDYAVRTWIQQCQESSYEIEISMMNNVRKKSSNIAPRIKQLGLFLDSNGLLRCNGRIHNAPVPELAKFPTTTRS